MVELHEIDTTTHLDRDSTIAKFNRIKQYFLPALYKKGSQQETTCVNIIVDDRILSVVVKSFIANLTTYLFNTFLIDIKLT